MQDDAIHLPITTGSAAIIYGWTLQDIVLIMWAAYVFVLIVIKLPDFSISLGRIRDCIVSRWESWRGKDGD